MIYFTSDHHFSHSNIITYCKRPYTSVDEMNEDLITKWNSKVTQEDTVYYLGDFSLSLKAVEKFLPRLIRKKIILIQGNHDACHPSNKKSGKIKFRDYIDLGFENVELESMIKLNLNGKDTDVKMCHLPYAPEDSEQFDRRFINMRPKDEGGLLLHGHVHCAFQCVPKKRMINVGVDLNNYYPYSIEDICEIISRNDIKI